MEFTSASAYKYIKGLQDEKDRLLSAERETCTYVLSEGEVSDPPAYDYEHTRQGVDEIDRKTCAIRHALHRFNLQTTLPKSGITIDEALIVLAQLSAKRACLSILASNLPKERLGDRTRGGGARVIEYEYANYDIAQAESDYKAVMEMISNLQLEIDLVNQTEIFAVDI